MCTGTKAVYAYAHVREPNGEPATASTTVRVRALQVWENGQGASR